MRRLGYAEFLAREDEVAAAAAHTPEVSTFCSGPVWLQAAREVFGETIPEDQLLIVEEDGSWVILADRSNDGVYLPLEFYWLFANPLLGDPADTWPLLTRVARTYLGQGDLIALGGVRRNGDLHQIISSQASLDEAPLCLIREFPATDCLEIDLRGGVDEWLSRRSRKFQKSLRQAHRPDDIVIEDARCQDPRALFDRILSIQRDTAKWEGGDDIFQMEPYPRFYRSIMEKLSRREELRILFARRQGKDLGYIFGGVLGKVYRGLQMSYRSSARPWAIGNLLQVENLKRCYDEKIQTYDFGMPAEYKFRWADRTEEYSGLLIGFR
jgi:Acetyltransferase (GNAT) domain